MKFTSAILVCALVASVAAESTLEARAPKGGKRAGNNNGGGNGGGGNNAAVDCSQKSGNGLLVKCDGPTTLDPNLVQTGLEANGQAAGAEAGQIPSSTSNNNFLFFCQGKTPQNGAQVKTGSCNPTPMGDLVPFANLPASKFTNPKNMDTIAANQAFTITMAVKNIQMGNFVNPATNYYSAPQQIQNGQVVGHSHFVIEKIDSLTSTQVTDPTTFAFFKGVNTAAQNGVVSVPVTAGLPAGVYRLASINAAANHQPILASVAQHGSMDDMVYFTVTNGGAAANNGGGNNNNGGGNNNNGGGAASGNGNGSNNGGGNANGGGNSNSGNGSGSGNRGKKRCSAATIARRRLAAEAKALEEMAKRATQEA